MKRQPEAQPVEVRHVARRTLLRRGGTMAVAAVAGATAAEALSPGAARAAAGGNMILGQANDADMASTSLTSAATGPSLTVRNTGDHAPLVLTQQAGRTFTQFEGGELANLDGYLYYTFDFGGTTGPEPGFVYTEFTANQVVTIRPQRILDTRNSLGRAQILNPAGNLDSAGRLLAGHTINVSLGSLEVAAEAAFCNLTAVLPLASGYMTLWPGGTRPATSSINFAKGAIVANFAVTGTSDTDTVSIFSIVTTHVLLDITALNVGNRNQIDPAILAAPQSAATSKRLATRAQAGTLPEWYSGRINR